MTDHKLELEVADRAYVFRGYLSNPEDLIKAANASTWSENTHTLYEDGLIKRYETEVAAAPGGSLSTSFIPEVQNALNKYAELVKSKVDPSKYLLGATTNFYVSKYTNGGHIESHTDENYTSDNGIYTVILYLNDEYDGGSVKFDDYNSEIKPHAGDVLIFPSYYWHSGQAVSGGDKYMSIFRVRF